MELISANRIVTRDRMTKMAAYGQAKSVSSLYDGRRIKRRVSCLSVCCASQDYRGRGATTVWCAVRPQLNGKRGVAKTATSLRSFLPITSFSPASTPGPSIRQQLKLFGFSTRSSRLSRSRNAPPQEESRELIENYTKHRRRDLNRDVTLWNLIFV
jgi:hypothetical protein